MGLSWLVRARWRLVGAWMWPAFVVLAAADCVIGHALPLAGDSQTIVGGLVLALICNLVAVAIVARPLGSLLRTRRRDLPVDIARNYAGTAGIVVITLAFTAIGLAHHASITRDRDSARDASARAAAWIGDHAPAPFRSDPDELSVVVIQPDMVYRACASNPAGSREFCVVVNERSGSIVPDGSETNQTLSRGMN